MTASHPAPTTRARILRVLALVMVLILPAAWAQEPGGRHIGLVLDTSSSMDGADTDAPRYTVQIAKILTDLLGPQDALTVAWIPPGTGCDDGPRPDAALALGAGQAGQGAAFKGRLDAAIHYGGGTLFTAPLRTLAAGFAATPAMQRLMILITDATDFSCGPETAAELKRLRDDGATLAVVNLGSHGGGFSGHPDLDLTRNAARAAGLVSAVGEIYQRFLGARQPAGGVLSGPEIRVAVAPFVRTAYLLVAADGSMAPLVSLPGNPAAAALDLDYRGGGTTTGTDRRTRAYRIVRLDRPRPGTWRFRAPDLPAGAGWLLLQDFSLGLRFTPPATVAAGAETRLAVELVDTADGDRVVDPRQVPGLAVTLEADGRRLHLRDDGQDGDIAGDGVLSAGLTFATAGRMNLRLHLTTDHLERTRAFNLEVAPARWVLHAQVADRATVGVPLPVAVELEPVGEARLLAEPDAVRVTDNDGQTLTLRAVPPVPARGQPRHYSGTWRPRTLGEATLRFTAPGSSPTAPVEAKVRVLGEIALGDPIPLDLGEGSSGVRLEGTLDLSFVRIAGEYAIAVSADYDGPGTALELDLGQGWQPLGARPQTLTLRQDEARALPLRLRIGRCPAAVAPGTGFDIRVTAVRPDGQAIAAAVPLTLGVTAAPWLVCWWPVLAGVAGLAVLGVIIHGYVSPFRFPRNLSVQISPEADLEEGFPYLIRAQRGAGSGFYRDARLYVRADYRLGARPGHAVASLRAGRAGVHLTAMGGALLQVRGDDGRWVALSPHGCQAQLGITYRTDAGTLFFELRTG
ncbi:vWA domain-containing protein [Lamprocystis purpurea]|uniref:VWA domain-containing protein n=1 Tax=Lamprocystis purpurea TaxID=61598 RepID=UPI00035E551C|nr:VWA domain-containing protein [Lamprocystis purpurea]